MKTWITGVLLTAALIAFFSTYTGTPSGTQTPGKSGVVLTGKSSEGTEIVIRQETAEIVIRQEAAEGETPIAETAESAAEANPEDVEEKSVDDMLLMFWHGVAAVIIGEMLALIAAVAWAIIKGKR